MKRHGTSESTSYFAFIVLILLGLFLYSGFLLNAPDEFPTPAPPLLTASVESYDNGIILVPEKIAPTPDRIPAVSMTAYSANTGGNSPSQPTPVAARSASIELNSYSSGIAQPKQNYVSGLTSSGSALVYIVRPNDTLTGIAQNMLGSTNRWREIANLNAEALPNPNELKPGMRIYLPKRQASVNKSAQVDKLYLVKENDSLYSLAVRFYKTPYAVSIIREANKEILESRTELLPGMELRLPSPNNPGSWKAGRTYTVKTGDVLSEIAKRFYNDSNQWKRIIKANPTVITDEKQLKVGAVLIIP